MKMTQTLNETLRRTYAVSPERPLRHFNQIDLSRRWNISPRTLERWRWLKQGPEYLKVGGRVLYRLEDVEAFEAANRRRLSSAK
jgi:hypothetical protein